MKRFLNGVLVIAGLASVQAQGAVFDKFDCTFGIMDLLTGVESTQKSSVDSVRTENQKPQGWSANVRLFSGRTFEQGSFKNSTGSAVGVYNTQYFVAQQYDEAGQLIAAKVRIQQFLQGRFCEPGKPCLFPDFQIAPENDPFLHPSLDWKDMGISQGLAVLNAEDFSTISYGLRDSNGRYDFTLTAGCSFKSSIKTAPGE